MLRTLHKVEQESISMPCQVKSLFNVFPQMNVDLIDYDYIGEAKEEDYSSFASTLYKIYGNSDNCILVMHSSLMKDCRLLRKTFSFDLTGYEFEEDMRTLCVQVTEESIVFLGFIPIKTNEDFKSAVKFLFSGIYDSQNFLMQSKSFSDMDEIITLLKKSLCTKRDRYGNIKNICISMPLMCQHKHLFKVLYPYGGTDFGSFMLFIFFT